MIRGEGGSAQNLSLSLSLSLSAKGDSAEKITMESRWLEILLEVIIRTATI